MNCWSLEAVPKEALVAVGKAGSRELLAGGGQGSRWQAAAELNPLEGNWRGSNSQGVTVIALSPQINNPGIAGEPPHPCPDSSGDQCNKQWQQHASVQCVLSSPSRAAAHRPGKVTAHCLPLHQLQPDVNVKLPAVLDVFMAAQGMFAGRMNRKKTAVIRGPTPTCGTGFRRERPGNSRPPL